MLGSLHTDGKVDCCRNRRQIGNNLNSTACRGRHCRQLGRLCRQCVPGFNISSYFLQHMTAPVIPVLNGKILTRIHLYSQGRWPPMTRTSRFSNSFIICGAKNYQTWPLCFVSFCVFFCLFLGSVLLCAIWCFYNFDVFCIHLSQFSSCIFNKVELSWMQVEYINFEIFDQYLAMCGERYQIWL